MSRNRGESLPAVFYCRWNWCISQHRSSSDLAHHVIIDHARKAQPMRRGDLAAIERVEEGIGETLSIPGHMHGISFANQTRKEPSPSQERVPTSSLPTPPGSDLASPQIYVQPLAASPKGKRKLEIPQDTGVDPNLLSAPFPTPMRQLSRSPNQQKPATPSFAYLSSREDSPFKLDNPRSPEFNAIIEQAIHPNKRQRTRMPSKSVSRYPSHVSNSSNKSVLSVEKYLTQSADGDVSDNEWQLSDLIRPDKLHESVNMDGSLTEASTSYSRQSLQVSNTPATQSQNPQPSFTQEDSYRGDIFGSRVRSPSVAPATQSSHSTSQDPSWAQDHSTSTSSDLSMPPPAQRPRELPTQSQQSEHSSTSSDSNFFPPLTSSSGPLKQAWYGPVHTSIIKEEELVLARDAFLQPPAAPARKSKKNPKYMYRSGSLRSSVQMSPPLKRRSSMQPAPDGGLIHRHHNHPREQESIPVDSRESQDDDWEIRSQEEEDTLSFPPLQTQAPYQSQDMSY